MSFPTVVASFLVMLFGASFIVAWLEQTFETDGLRWTLKGSALFLAFSFVGNLCTGVNMWTAAAHSFTAYLWIIALGAAAIFVYASFGGSIDEQPELATPPLVHDARLYPRQGNRPLLLSERMERGGQEDVYGMVEPDPPVDPARDDPDGWGALDPLFETK